MLMMNDNDEHFNDYLASIPYTNSGYLIAFDVATFGLDIPPGSIK